MQPLVSIITACYNGEDYVHRLLESVIEQSYPDIELVFINDGSVDKTEQIVLSYKERIEKKGYSFIYIYQENAGQAAAVSKGLKSFHGDYLTWIDSDDWFTADSIEKRVDYLEQNSSVGILFSSSQIVSEDNVDIPLETVKRLEFEGSFFDFLIDNKNVFWAPVSYMVRSSMFLDALPSREIYAGRSGQNIQMLLPIAYYYPLAQLESVSGYYLIRRESHSHIKKSPKEELIRVTDREDTYCNTIENISMYASTKQKYLKYIKDMYARKRFPIAYEIKDREIMRKEYENLKLNSTVSRGARDSYQEIVHPWFYKCKTILRNIFHGTVKK